MNRVIISSMKRALLWTSGAALAAGLVSVGLGISRGSWLPRFPANPLVLKTAVTPSGPVVLNQVQRLQRLETCRYNGQVVLKGETRNPLPLWLAGDRMVMVAHGEAVAGVDLARLRPEDVQVQGETVTLRVPAAEVFHVRLDNDRSEVFSRQTGVFTGPDRRLETRVRRDAETRLREAAVSSGLLNTAGQNARDVLRQQLELLGFKHVRFDGDNPAPAEG